MVDVNILNKIKQLVPLINKISLFELGTILFIIFSLCKTDNFVPLSNIISSYNGLFSNGVMFSSLIITLGILRKATVVDLSHNFSQNNKNIDAIFLHLYELKMISSVQIPCEVMVGIKLFKILPDFIIDKLAEKISFFLVFDYFSDQIDLDVSSYGLKADEVINVEKRNKKKTKVSINNHLGKPECIVSVLILPKKYENKELVINLRLEPVKTNKFFSKIFYTPLFILSYLLFPWKKMLII